MSMTIDSHLASSTIEGHLALRHDVWRFGYVHSETPQAYGTLVSEADLHVIHEKLHESDSESDHPYAVGE
jgi:hypothetical protein